MAITTLTISQISMQASNSNKDIYYSIGLVIVCLLILVLLWLPDMLGGRN